MNDTEYKILQRLRNNARFKLTEMSKTTKIPISTIFDKIRQLDGNLIDKFTVLLSFGRMGLYKAMLAIKVGPEQKQEVMEHLKQAPCVNNLWRINNGYDFLIEVVFSHMRELDDFLENMDKSYKLRKKETFFVLDDVKRETFLSEDYLVHDQLLDG